MKFVQFNYTNSLSKEDEVFINPEQIIAYAAYEHGSNKTYIYCNSKVWVVNHNIKEVGSRIFNV